MPPAAASLFPHWSSYFAIAGSSAAALTGLMFVVVTLAANRMRSSHETSEAFRAFSTPTVVHFCAALLLSGIAAAPWHSLFVAGTVIGIAGACGVLYQLRVTRRTARVTAYDPLPEDWLWYAVMPFFAYLAVVLTAILFAIVPTHALFVLAGATMLLIFIGIHNAWDIVTYIVIDLPQERAESESTPPAAR
jgi:hypothetical protein